MQTFTIRNNLSVTIREAEEKDAEGILSFVRLIFASTDQVLTTPEEFTITLEQERTWVRSYSETPTSLILVAEADSKIIGLLDFACKTKKKMSHTGEFGVSVHPDYQCNGIGRRLIETLLQWASLKAEIEKVFLNVYETNPRAIALYSKLGFTEECKQVRAIKQPKGDYADMIQMSRFLR
jgi:ribosomal protein S18 acetylase RimI-like enzyme